jgi:hypothetical protein
MAEIVNLCRARKARVRSEAAAQANANRVKHSANKGERNLVKAEAAKTARDLAARKLDEKP